MTINNILLEVLDYYPLERHKAELPPPVKDHSTKLYTDYKQSPLPLSATLPFKKDPYFTNRVRVADEMRKVRERWYPKEDVYVPKIKPELRNQEMTNLNNTLTKLHGLAQYLNLTRTRY